MLLSCAGMIYSPAKITSKPRMVNLYPGDKAIYKSGDIVVRQGKGWISEIFKKFSTTEHKYSHAGVLMLESGKPYVYHCIGTNNGSKGGMKKEPLSEFCNSQYVTSFAIYQTPFFETSSCALQKYFKSLSQKNIQFDDEFDLSTDHQLYCSEMIYKMLQEVYGYSLEVSTFKGQKYVAIDNLYLKTRFTKITEIKYISSQ
ncbi:MAG: hypothetical protein IPP71_14960 [Bacteroidetes bacterium]|nr:hypothetical protein [Bacteroidota bacterium]